MIKYIDEPIKMNEEALQDIKALLEKYPFFHTANLLFVKAAHNLQDNLYNSEINKISASIPNREILHDLINMKEIQIVVKEKTKPKESKTRTDIRKRISERREKRKEDKVSQLLKSGKTRHLSLIKDFFEPVFEKLVSNIENFRVVIKNDILSTKEDEVQVETSIEDQRAKKKAEREKRMAEKRRLKAEVSEGDNKEKRKAEREKRRIDREKRMAARLAGNVSEESTEIKEDIVLDDREKRKLERQKRREDKEKEIAKQIAEKNTETKNDILSTKEDIIVDDLDDREKRKLERQKRREEKEKKIAEQIAKQISENKNKEAGIEETEKQTSEAVVITVENNDEDNLERRKKERQKRKEEKEKKVAEQISENKNKDKVLNEKKEHSSGVVIVTVDGGTSGDIEKIKEEKENEIVKQIVEKTDIVNKEKSTSNKENDDPYTKIISIDAGDGKDKVLEKEKEEKITTKEVKTVSNKKSQKLELKDKENSSDDEIDDIYSKILNSKRTKPLLAETKKEVLDSGSDEINIDVKKEGETKNDEIEFIVESNKDKTEESIPIKVENNKNEEEIVILDEKEEVFELLETKEDKLNPEVEVKEKKAANGVLDKIAAYKSKKDKISKKNTDKKEVSDESETSLKVENVKKEITKNVELDLSDNNLIDKFISGKPAMKRQDVEDTEETVDISEGSSKVKKPVITELMASIYINQGKYNQAIEIYDQLILKNPEKKDYFASKIKETENLK